jgi:hypothetical protein
MPRNFLTSVGEKNTKPRRDKLVLLKRHFNPNTIDHDRNSSWILFLDKHDEIRPIPPLSSDSDHME